MHCEVCITYNGSTNCGNSAATTREQAERTATDLACNGLTGNMTELMQCQNSPDQKDHVQVVTALVFNYLQTVTAHRVLIWSFPPNKPAGIYV